MFDEELKAIWKRGDAGAKPLSREDIEGLLRPAAHGTGSALATPVITHVVMLAVTALLALANLPGYRDNPTMLAVEIAIAAVSAGGCVAGARLIAGLRRISRADVPLIEMVERRLRFTERWYEPWILLGTVTPWMLTLALNTLIDNQDGTYPINHPWEFAVVTAVMLAITYVTLKLSTATTVRELHAVLHDLRAETLEQTPGMDAVKRCSRIWMRIAVLLLSLGVLLGILLWLKLL